MATHTEATTISQVLFHLPAAIALAKPHICHRYIAILSPLTAILGVYLHVLADTLGSVGVITSSALVHYFGWTIADPVCSFCISMLIFFSVIPLLRSSASTLLQCTPRGIEPSLPALLSELQSVDGVLACRDVHVWSHSSSVSVATAHVLVRSEVEEQKMLATLSHLFKKRLNVTYLTVQIEKVHYRGGFYAIYLMPV